MDNPAARHELTIRILLQEIQQLRYENAQLRKALKDSLPDLTCSKT